MDVPPEGASNKFFITKWTTFVSMYVGYTLVTLDKKSFTFAVPAIMKDLNLHKDDLGLVTSSQNLAYTMSKFFGGVLSDRVSSRLLFSSGLAVAGVLTVGFTGFESASAFAVLWFLQGIVLGGAWPACAKMLKQWCPRDQFGTFWSVLSSSRNFACTFGPLLATALCWSFSWQFIFRFFGLLSLVLAIVCFCTMVDSPRDIGFDSFEDVKENKGNAKSPSRGRGVWQDMLSSPFMWLLCGSYMVVFMCRTAALDWAQLFLIQEVGQSEFTGSSFISALEIGGFVGSIAAGYAADRLVAMVPDVCLSAWQSAFNVILRSNREDTRGTPRMLVAISFMCVCILSLHCMLFTVSAHSSQIWITLIGFMLGFGLYGPIALYGVMAIEAAPTHLTGMSHAIVALSANVGAIFAGLPLSVVATYLNWKGAFVILEVLLITLLAVKIFTRNVEYKMITIKKKLQ